MHPYLTWRAHVSTMTDGVPSMQMHHMAGSTTCRYANCCSTRARVVCPEGLNSELEALQFTFPELPLWDMAAPGEHFREPQLLEVDLGSVQPEGMTTAIQAPTTIPVLIQPSGWYYWASPWHCHGHQLASARGPWNGCSGLPPQPQPLSPSVVCT